MTALTTHEPWWANLYDPNAPPDKRLPAQPPAMTQASRLLRDALQDRSMGRRDGHQGQRRTEHNRHLRHARPATLHPPQHLAQPRRRSQPQSLSETRRDHDFYPLAPPATWRDGHATDDQLRDTIRAVRANPNVGGRRRRQISLSCGAFGDIREVRWEPTRPTLPSSAPPTMKIAALSGTVTDM